MWVVIVSKPYVREVVVGPFHDEIKADEWAARINEGYPDLWARTDWLYSGASDRDVVKEALADLVAEESDLP